MNDNRQAKRIKFPVILGCALILVLVLCSLYYASMHHYKNVAYFEGEALVYNDENYVPSEDEGYTVDKLIGEVDRELRIKLTYYQLVYSVTEDEDVVALTTRRDGYAFYRKVS